MTIQDWGAIGEIVGAVGIVVTLVYLAQQIRFARLASVDTTRQHRVAGIREITNLVLTDPRVGRAWNKVVGPNWEEGDARLREAYGLDAEEARIVWDVAGNWMWTHWAQFHSLKSASDEAELRRLVHAFYTHPPMDLMITFPRTREHFDPAFWDWLDATLADAPQRTDAP